MMYTHTNKAKLLVALSGFFLVLILIAGLLGFEKVPAGHQAVIYSPSGVKEETKSPGFHWIGFFNKAIEYPVKTQTKEYKSLNVATKDGKNLKMSISVSYNVNPTKVTKIFNKFGNADISALENGYLKQRVQDALRQSVSKYSVIEAFGVRTAEIKTETLENVQKRLDSEGFQVEDVALSSPEADGATQSAIDERVKANQELERTKTDKEIAKQNAEKKEIEALGEARANEIVNKSLTDQLIKKEMIDKWSGDKPISIGGESIIVDSK